MSDESRIVNNMKIISSQRVIKTHIMLYINYMKKMFVKVTTYRLK